MFQTSKTFKCIGATAKICSHMVRDFITAPRRRKKPTVTNAALLQILPPVPHDVKYTMDLMGHSWYTYNNLWEIIMIMGK